MIGLNPLNDRNKQRESQFELIRIIAQFFIVLYHLLLVFVYPVTQSNLHKAIWLPLHIGVPLFILISGYFGIRPSIKGFVKLAGMVFVLTVPLQLADFFFFRGGGLSRLFHISCFFMGSGFWFVRTYIFLYLFSPVINKYLQNITILQRIYLIGILALISIYAGDIMEYDLSLFEGKNLINFILIYVLGNTLSHFRHIWSKWPNIKLLTAWVLFNAVPVITFSILNPNAPIVMGIYRRFFFSYSSPGLLINSIIFFMVVGQYDFHSKFINHVAKSSLAIYIIHCSFIPQFILYGPLVKYIVDQYSSNNALLFSALLMITFIIIVACVLFDNLLSPIWKMINRLGNYCQSLINPKLLILSKIQN